MADSAKEVMEAPLECGRYDNYGGGPPWLRKGVTGDVGMVRLCGEDMPKLLAWMHHVFPNDMAKLLSEPSEKRQEPSPAEDEGIRSIDWFRKYHFRLQGTGISADKAADIVLVIMRGKL